LAPRPKVQDVTPDDFSEIGGGGRSGTYDLGQKVGSIERSVIYLEGTTSATSEKVDKLLLEFSEARGSFKTFRWVAGLFGAAMVFIWGFIATVAGMWLKHHMGW
jgi:hypothetical protein